MGKLILLACLGLYFWVVGAAALLQASMLFRTGFSWKRDASGLAFEFVLFVLGFFCIRPLLIAIF